MCERVAYIHTPTMISKEEIRSLAALSRIELTEEEESKLQHDLGNILAHIGELQAVNTDNVMPLAGGSFLANQFRTDDDASNRIDNAVACAAFPESTAGFLKVPPVFE